MKFKNCNKAHPQVFQALTVIAARHFERSRVINARDQQKSMGACGANLSAAHTQPLGSVDRRKIGKGRRQGRVIRGRLEVRSQRLSNVSDGLALGGGQSSVLLKSHE